MTTRYLKDPDAVLDWKFDWKALTNGSGPENWLETGETIASHTVTAAAGLTVDSSSLTDGNTSVTVWLSGGTVRNGYDVTCHITTSNGRQDDRTIRIYVVER